MVLKIEKLLTHGTQDGTCPNLKALKYR